MNAKETSFPAEGSVHVLISFLWKYQNVFFLKIKNVELQVFFNSHLETILWRYQFYTGIYDQSILKWLKYKYFQEIFLRNVIYCILVATVVNCLDQLYSEFPYYFSFLVDNLLALNETQQKLCLFNFRFFLWKIVSRLFHLEILVLFDSATSFVSVCSGQLENSFQARRLYTTLLQIYCYWFHHLQCAI